MLSGPPPRDPRRRRRPSSRARPFGVSPCLGRDPVPTPGGLDRSGAVHSSGVTPPRCSSSPSPACSSSSRACSPAARSAGHLPRRPGHSSGSPPSRRARIYLSRAGRHPRSARWSIRALGWTRPRLPSHSSRPRRPRHPPRVRLRGGPRHPGTRRRLHRNPRRRPPQRLCRPRRVLPPRHQRLCRPRRRPLSRLPPRHRSQRSLSALRAASCLHSK
jgi:hypothetical protein